MSDYRDIRTSHDGELAAKAREENVAEAELDRRVMQSVRAVDGLVKGELLAIGDAFRPWEFYRGFLIPIPVKGYPITTERTTNRYVSGEPEHGYTWGLCEKPHSITCYLWVHLRYHRDHSKLELQRCGTLPNEVYERLDSVLRKINRTVFGVET